MSTKPKSTRVSLIIVFQEDQLSKVLKLLNSNYNCDLRFDMWLAYDWYYFVCTYISYNTHTHNFISPKW